MARANLRTIGDVPRPDSDVPPGRGAREITLRDPAEALHAHERLCLQRRRHARADEFDGAHQRRVRQRGEVHLKRQSRDSAEYFVVVSDLVDDLVRPADNQRTTRARIRVEAGASEGPQRRSRPALVRPSM